MSKLYPLVAAATLSVAPASAQFDAWMDELGSKLRFESADSAWRGKLSGTLDFAYHSFEGLPPSLMDVAGQSHFQPRAILHFDFQAGDRLYGYLQARIDNGFDPSDGPSEARIDEALLRYSAIGDNLLNLQIGQFATIVGQWRQRHLPWDNPLITAPLAYEQVTRFSDYETYAYADWRAYLYDYNPLIWGPVYATGFAASGEIGEFEWAYEIKNAALMSRPAYWDFGDNGFDYPNHAVRIAWKPDLRWNVGLSLAEGPYLGPYQIESLPAAWNPRDYKQSTAILDASFEWHHLRVWSEIAFSKLRVLGAGDVDTTSGFIEASYKIRPRVILAARLNAQNIGASVDDWGEVTQWGDDQIRLDLGITYRFSAYTQLQLEVDLRDNRTDVLDMGTHFSSRFTVRF